MGKKTHPARGAVKEIVTTARMAASNVRDVGWMRSWRWAPWSRVLESGNTLRTFEEEGMKMTVCKVEGEAMQRSIMRKGEFSRLKEMTGHWWGGAVVFLKELISVICTEDTG